MELTDSHCHIQSVGASAGEAATRALWAKAGDAQPEDVIARARRAGVTRLICVGCDLEDSRLAVEFVKSRENCWASIGIHPHEAHRYAQDLTRHNADDSSASSPYGSADSTPNDTRKPECPNLLGEFTRLATKPKVVAIGECGLDYFYENSDKASQIKMLEFQIELALEHDLPLIFHVREAFNDFWPVFERYTSKQRPIRGVLHSFTDTKANLGRAIGHELYIGINGIATFTKKPEQQELYRTVPLRHVLLETDAPFLTPTPDRGKICEPYHIGTIAEFLAEAREESVEEIATATTNNAQQLFRI